MRALSMMIKPVSGACNMRCRYCFYADVMENRSVKIYPRMTLETLEIIVRRIFRYADGPVSLTFQGGEPTLIGLDYFQALVGFVRSYNTRKLPVHYAVQTNGYDLSDEMIAFFAREDFLLGVSLDGIPETHDAMRVDIAGLGTYAHVQTTIDRLQAAKAQFNLLCVVNAQVAQRPREVFQALAPYGYIQFIPCLDALSGEGSEHSLTSEAYAAFLKETFDLYFAAYRNGKPISVRNFDNYIGILLGMPPENCAMSGECAENLLIESDGSVYPCDFYVLDAWKLGNIAETPLNRLLKTESAIAFRQASKPVPECCRRCAWYDLCRNGCRRERDPETGVFRWCESIKDFFEYAHARMGKIAQLIRSREAHP